MIVTNLNHVKPKLFNLLFRIFQFVFLSVFILPILNANAHSDKREVRVAFTEKEQRWLAKDRTVRIRIGKAPPYSFFREEPLGISTEYLNIVAQRAGFQVKYISDIPWPDALKHIKNREKIDLLPALTETMDRREHIAFTQNYLTSPQVIFTREDGGFVKSLEDLAGKTISVERGYFLQQKLSDEYPNIKLLIKETTKDALESLSLGETDAYVGNLISSTYIIRMKGLNNIKIAAPAPFGNLNLAMGVRSDWPELASIINKVLANFNDKEHVAIRDKWVASIRYDYGISTADILKWILGISSIAFVIIITFLLWNKKLAKEIISRKKIDDALNKSNRILTSMIENTDEYILVSDENASPVRFNKAYARVMRDMLGIEMKPGLNPHKLLPNKDVINWWDNLHKRVLNGEKFQVEYSHEISQDEKKYFEIFFNPVFEHKKAIGFTEYTRDITDRKQAEDQIKASLKEKETLLQEIHHRVKNNMSVISSLLKLQMNSVDNNIAKQALQDSQNRVQSMSMIHETLYRSENLSAIDLNTYLSELGRTIFQNYSISSKVLFKVEAESIMIGAKQASPVGLIVNELITNSLKYAFPDERQGEITVRLKKMDEELELTIKDNGVGIPEELDWKNSTTLGLQLVTTLVENQLDGSIDLDKTNGISFTIKFNIDS